MEAKRFPTVPEAAYDPSQRPANRVQGANERLSDDQITKEKLSQIPEEEVADLGPGVNWPRWDRVADFRGVSGDPAPLICYQIFSLSALENRLQFRCVAKPLHRNGQVGSTSPYSIPTWASSRESEL